jgi:hypothetical protein
MTSLTANQAYMASEVFPCLADGEHLVQSSHNDGEMGSVTMEIPQGI